MEKIFSKESSISSAAAHINKLCDSGRLNLALKLIHQLVEEIITEPLCTSQVFGSKVLDELCSKIGRINLDNNSNNLSPLSSFNSHECSERIVYLVTKLQRSGGHTKVIKDFISSKPTALHIILSSELDGSSDVSTFNDLISKKIKIKFHLSKNNSYIEKLTWLQEKILIIRPERIYLFNNHHDSVAAATIQPMMCINSFFYHHGDHHLCLGVYLDNLHHIDPHPMGFHNCRNSLKINNYYIPLSVDDSGVRDKKLPFFSNTHLTTCTAARSNKVEIPYFVNYTKLVPQILNATGGKHIHIGNLTPWAIFEIHSGLKKHGISREKFVYIPYVPSVWTSLIEHKVDLYIASFPYGGGLTLIEAMGAGIPIALHNHINSKILSGLDLAYSNAFIWNDPENLLTYCKTVTIEMLNQASNDGRQHFNQNYSSVFLPTALENIFTETSRPLESENLFINHADEWAFSLVKQLSIKNIIRTRIYRTLKKIRRAWQSLHLS